MLEEGVTVEELSLPVRLRAEEGRLAGVVCTRMEYRGERDAGGRKVPVAVEGSEYELPFDTLLLAVSQHAVLDFFDGPQPELTEGGYLACDPETMETSLPGVYVAGDVAAHGPASIVRAAGDGKRAAAAIIAGARPRRGAASAARRPGRAHAAAGASRVAGAGAAHPAHPAGAGSPRPPSPTPRRRPGPRRSRCLDCDRFCSICVGVCPNLAIFTYAAEPMAIDLPSLRRRGGRGREGGGRDRGGSSSACRWRC